MKNKYFEEVSKYEVATSWRYCELTYNVPWGERDNLVYKYAWAIPDDFAISTIAKYGSIIEVGAGKGYWASLISKHTNIVAYDIAIKKNRYTDNEEKFYDVKKVNSKMLNKIFGEHPEKTLFLCWPPYGSPMAHNTLRKYKGEFLIYVGEGDGGCTGCDRFHNELEQKWELVEDQSIPQFRGLHDRLFVYKRK